MKLVSDHQFQSAGKTKLFLYISIFFLVFFSFELLSLNDTAKVNLLNRKAFPITRGWPDSSLNYGKEALSLAEKINYKEGKIMSYLNIGMAFHYKNDHNNAIVNLKKALQLSREAKNITLIADTYNNLTLAYRLNGDYAASINSAYEALKIFEELKNNSGILNSYNNIALVYNDEQNFEKALSFFLKVLPLLKYSDNSNKANIYNNLGLVYNELKNYDLAMKYFLESLKIREAFGNRVRIADVHTNIGVCYSSQKNYIQSQEYLFKALKVYEATNEEFYAEIAYTNIGDNFLQLKKYDEAAFYLNKGLLTAQKIDDKEGVKVACLALSELYAATGDFKNAFLFNRRYIVAKDSLLNQQNQNQIAQIQMKYETDKKDHEIELLNKDKLIQESVIAKQKTQKIAFIGGIILLAGFSFFIFRSFKRKQHDNKIITKQKDEVERSKAIIEEQKKEVDEKQKEILDSINYARRIQLALMTPETYIAKALKRLTNHKGES